MKLSMVGKAEIAMKDGRTIIIKCPECQEWWSVSRMSWHYRLRHKKRWRGALTNETSKIRSLKI